MRVILLFHKWMDGPGRVSGGAFMNKALQRPVKILFCRHPPEEIACGVRPSQVSVWLLMF